MKKYSGALPAILAVVLFYGFLHIMGIGCPIKYLTGVSCPGCGMTRAYLSLLRLDFAGAFYYHPLFLLPVIAVVMYHFKERIPGKLYTIWLFTLIGLFLIIYLLRISDPGNAVVVFRPRDGFIYKTFSLVYGLIGL